MRTSGILLPVSSLPSKYGIGTLGAQAFSFIDFLHGAGQSAWQVLPIGPTGFADSPYQSFSAFAGNPYLIDMDLLAEQGLLKPQELEGRWGEDEGRVDYGLLYLRRFKVLEKAAERQDKTAGEYLAFREKNAFWLDDYALFMAIKEERQGQSFATWPDDLRCRRPEAMQRARAQYGSRAEFWKCLQFFFFCQWKGLRQYAQSKGIAIIGDIPIYVSPDSSDLWANPLLFKLDDRGMPAEVAGVPPDDFSADGQHWGNPLYDWMYHRRTKYRWWIQRMQAAAELYDVVRIDHFRGFAGYYAIPAGEKTARNGRWLPGPGKDFVRALKKALPNLKLIAEDLGVLTPDVYSLMEYSGYPGMKVLQFAFSPDASSEYLPHNYNHNCVVYTGTHDNMTTAQWVAEAAAPEVRFAIEYLGVGDRAALTAAMIRAALMSVSNLAVIPLQDWLGLGAEARINTPSTTGGNWEWRLLPGQLDDELCTRIHRHCRNYGRLNPKAPAWATARVAKGVSAAMIHAAEEKAVAAGLGLAQLMENAGMAAADILMGIAREEKAGHSALILCGKGNNAGDGYVMARALHLAGWAVSVLPVFGKDARISSLAYQNRKKLPAGVKFADAATADFNAPFIVDAVFGIGFSGVLPRNVVACFERAAGGRGIHVALDVPSGMEADSGYVAVGAFNAAHTITFGAPKKGFAALEGRPPLGRVSVAAIGLEKYL